MSTTEHPAEPTRESNPEISSLPTQAAAPPEGTPDRAGIQPSAISSAPAADPRSPAMPAAESVMEPPEVPSSAPATPVPSAADRVYPSGCGCGGGESQGPEKLYALGQLDYDFVTESRRDSLHQGGLENPHDPAALLDYLESEPSSAASVRWILTQESTPIYAVHPAGPFAPWIYERLRGFLREQLGGGVERVSVPGYLGGPVTLASGQQVPALMPELRGMYSWSTPALVEAVLGAPPSKKEERDEHEQQAREISNFLERIYYEIRNLGQAPQERAINFAATNAFQVGTVYAAAISRGSKLDTIAVERSPICRPESDCWDVKLTFFQPEKRLEEARTVYRFTVDVSDVVPVTVGKMRRWEVY